MKQEPAAGAEERMPSISSSSTQMRSTPIDMPERIGMSMTGRAWRPGRRRRRSWRVVDACRTTRPEGAQDAQHREGQDHATAVGYVHEELEVHDADRDDGLEDEDHLALLDEVGLAGLEDELGDFEHRGVGGEGLDAGGFPDAQTMPRPETARPQPRMVVPETTAPKSVKGTARSGRWSSSSLAKAASGARAVTARAASRVKIFLFMSDTTVLGLGCEIVAKEALRGVVRRCLPL